MTCLGTWGNLRVASVPPQYLSWPGNSKGGGRHVENPE